MEKSLHLLLFYDITHLIDKYGYKIPQAHLYQQAQIVAKFLLPSQAKYALTWKPHRYVSTRCP